MSRSHIDAVMAALQETESDPLLIDRRADGLSGISGLKTVGLLQRLARLFEGDASASYLEIGVFQGLTLVATALAAPKLPCFGIDNFRILDPEAKNLSIVEDRLKRFETSNAALLNMDFEAALESLETHLGGRKVAVYLVDGPHDYRSQLVSLLLIKPHLHENAVIIIDDANYPDVRWSTRDFLMSHPDFKLAFDAYAPDHPANLSNDDKAVHEASWLNGVHVLVRDPDQTLQEMLPPINPDFRDLYFNEWLTHRLRFAELAPQALALAEAVLNDEGSAPAARLALREAYNTDQKRFDGRHADRNLFSADLPKGRLNKP